MKPLSCDEALGGLSDFLAGECQGPLAARLRSHLGTCAACRGRAEEWVWQDRVIAELSGRARLEKLASRIHQSLESLDQIPVVESGRARPRPWLRVAAAAGFLIASCAIAAVLLRSSHETRVAHEDPAPKRPPAGASQESKKSPPYEAPRVPREHPRLAPPQAPPESPESEPPKPPVLAQKPPSVEKPKGQDPNIPVAPEGPKSEARETPREAPPVKSKPIDVVTLKTPDAAIERGVAFLRTKSPELEFSRISPEARQEELVLWTYFMAGVPENDPEFQRLFRGITEQKLERTYDVALLAMFLEELDRVKYRGRIHQCAQFLVDNQCRNGQWNYGAPSLFVEDIPTGALPTSAPGKPIVRDFTPPYARGEKPKVKGPPIPVTKRREGPESGDNSNSMYAALGLRACHDAGIAFPPEVLRAAERAWRESYNGEGWCYGPKGHGHKAYGSMTAGAVGSLVILDYIQGRDWRRDREVELGLKWLAKNFSVTEHKGPPEHAAANPTWMQYYYMYALERAGILYGAEKIGSHEWYKEGVEALLDAQRLDDGSWVSQGGNKVNDTCFAILFLRRATRGLPAVATK